MVSDQADIAGLPNRLGATVGLGAVADDVAQAPDLVRGGALDLLEDGLEGGQVRVDVADDGYVHVDPLGRGAGVRDGSKPARAASDGGLS